MSLLNRPDGIQFVVQPYRERLTLTKRSLMVQKIKALSEQHGQYVLLSPIDQYTIETVFSREPGYLLGETVWSFFNKPAYLIFCERLSRDNNQVLLVIIRNNEVYLDALVDNDKLRTELLPLISSTELFKVITFGDVSLVQNDPAPAGSFTLPKNLVSSFEVYKEPVYKNLLAQVTWRLLTLPLALKSPLLGARIPIGMVVAGVAILISGVWWVYYLSSPTQPEVQKITAQKNDNSYTDFYVAMRTPPPSEQLSELAKTIEKFYGLPGWQVSGVKYAAEQYNIQLAREGGTLEWLTQWVNNHHYSLNLGSNGAEVALSSDLTRRPQPDTIYTLQPVVASLIDQLDRVFPDQVVNISDIKQFGLTKSRTLTINLANVSPDVLVLIGKTLGNLPLSITAINVNLHTGLISGSIQLSVWGI